MSNEQEFLHTIDAAQVLKDVPDRPVEAPPQVLNVVSEKDAAAAKIDRDLAFAVGHSVSALSPSNGDMTSVYVRTHDEKGGEASFRFDHTDPKIIWPIAERYDCFPYKTASGAWTTNLLAPSKDNMDNGVESAALAVALTVIQEYGL